MTRGRAAVLGFGALAGAAGLVAAKKVKRRRGRTWKPLIRQRQFLHRQRLSKPGEWARRHGRGSGHIVTDSRTELTLLILAERVKQFTGHIEDMSDDERVFLLGAFAGAADRLRERVRELRAENRADGYMEALPPLHQVMRALGCPEDWAEGEGT